MAAIFFESKLFYKISPGVSRQGEEFQDQVKRGRALTPGGNTIEILEIVS